MTTEHKILTMIDRGIRSEGDIVALLDRDQAAFWLSMAIYDSLVLDTDCDLSLSRKGLDRLNELDGFCE